MIDLALNSLTGAFSSLLDPTVLVVILAGVVWGSICGAMPGMGSGLAMGVVLPLTFGLDAVPAVALLIAISVSVQYGNGIPAVLLGVPGTPGSFLTAIDGYALSKRGETGLGMATMWLGGLVGQLISIPFFLLLVVPLSTIGYTFLSPELFALYTVGLAALVSLAGENIFKGIAAASLGVALSLVGSDPVSSISRFDFGVLDLRAGLPIIAVTLGFVTTSEILVSMRQTFTWDELQGDAPTKSKFPGFRRLRRLLRPATTGGLIGSSVGTIPGMSGVVSVVLSYQQAKLTSKTPEEFGYGSTEGIASNEAAGNSSQGGELVPTLGLGIPASDSMVILLGALLLQGMVPGPQLIQVAPELLYATVAGLIGAAIVIAVFGWYIANSLLKLTRLDRRMVFSVAFVMTMLGVYSLYRSVFDVIVLLACTLLGYYMRRYGYPPVAAAVGLLLGRGFEANLRQGLLLMEGDIIRFITRPWTATFLLLALCLVVYGSISTMRSNRRAREVREARKREVAESRTPH